MSDCGEKVGGWMARRNLALNKVLGAVDRDCAREEGDLAAFEEENLLVRQELLLRYLDLGADPRARLPPAWSGTRVRVVY